jgi:hypothetical protein
MESKSVNWLISYKIVGSERILTMEISLNFNKERNVARWFNVYKNKGNLEFINAIVNEKTKND